MSEMLRDIEEDMKRERLQQLWNRFGKLLVALSVVVLLGTVAWVVWQDHKRDYEMAQTAQFIKGNDRMKLEDYQGAIAAFSELTNATASPYYGLSMLKKAQAQQLGGDKPAALKTYEQLAVKPNNIFADLGKLLAASHGSTQALTPAPTGPFYASAQELHAWQLLQQGKKGEAITQFTLLLGNASAPASLHERAKDILLHIAPEHVPAAGAPMVKISEGMAHE